MASDSALSTVLWPHHPEINKSSAKIEGGGNKTPYNVINQFSVKKGLVCMLVDYKHLHS
jgi:hypothetical protein